MPTDWSDDDALLGDLGDALDERDQAPSRIARQGRELYVWRTADAELSELAADSAAEGRGAPALMRTDTWTRRSLTFRATALTIEVDLEHDPDALRGQVVAAEDSPGAPDEVTAEGIDQEQISTTVDPVGYFAFEHFPFIGSRFRLRCGAVVTPWID